MQSSAILAQQNPKALKFSFDKAAKLVTVHFDKPVQPGEQFVLKSGTNQR